MKDTSSEELTLLTCVAGIINSPLSCIKITPTKGLLGLHYCIVAFPGEPLPFAMDRLRNRYRLDRLRHSETRISCSMAACVLIISAFMDAFIPGKPLFNLQILCLPAKRIRRQKAQGVEYKRWVHHSITIFLTLDAASDCIRMFSCNI